MKELSLASLRSSVVVACASIVLAACGADDSTSVSDTGTSNNASQPNAAPSALNAAIPASGPFAPSAASMPVSASMSTANAQGDAQNTQDNTAILSAQASLAADSQQIAPVMRYAPGDNSH
jgi:hypothetical protein